MGRRLYSIDLAALFAHAESKKKYKSGRQRKSVSALVLHRFGCTFCSCRVKKNTKVDVKENQFRRLYSIDLAALFVHAESKKIQKWTSKKISFGACTPSIWLHFLFMQSQKKIQKWTSKKISFGACTP